MKKIKLYKGQFALVDDEDFEYINQWNWHLSINGYARAYNKKIKKHILMHQIIMNVKTDRKLKQIDHINMNKLDNQRKNLRVVSSSENHMNNFLKTNTSGHKNIYWAAWAKSWRVLIGAEQKSIHLGYFKSLKEAILARNNGIKKYHGEFGRII